MNLLASALADFKSIISDTAVVVVPMILTPIIVSAVVLWAERTVKKQNKNLDENDFKVTFNKLGLSCMTFLVWFLALSAIPFIVLYFVLGDMPIGALIGVCVGLEVCAIIALAFLLMMYRWKICVCGDAITYIPLAGKKREYNLNDISRVEFRSQEHGIAKYLVYFSGSDKKAFVFNNLMVGAELFVFKLSKNSKL